MTLMMTKKVEMILADRGKWVPAVTGFRTLVLSVYPVWQVPLSGCTSYRNSLTIKLDPHASVPPC